jgi:hypothetical protein
MSLSLDNGNGSIDRVKDLRQDTQKKIHISSSTTKKEVSTGLIVFWVLLQLNFQFVPKNYKQREILQL